MTAVQWATVLHTQAGQRLLSLKNGWKTVREILYLAFLAQIDSPASASAHVHIGGGVIWFDPWTFPAKSCPPDSRAESGHDSPERTSVKSTELPQTGPSTLLSASEQRVASPIGAFTNGKTGSALTCLKSAGPQSAPPFVRRLKLGFPIRAVSSVRFENGRANDFPDLGAR
ncbi:hypothetical protein MPL3365_170129 [Mesorhizobium plurifarium]|uniref:Uncharacterized protein n=1 Tax=Mesorhizobium plurifarium TaxID=69974 RepID=A0A090FZ67_MESPL|nr:hypothetical protein MPL3365_170129 [Mesorhizobium plurifarium]